MRRPALLFIALMAVLLAALSAHAFAPSKITFQGRMTLADGTPVTGSRQVTFRLYDAYSWQEIWSSGTVVVSFDNGLFTVVLGESPQPSLEGVNLNTLLDLGISLRGEPEMSPRTRLSSAPYAMTTGSIDGADAGRISGLITVYNDVYPTVEVASLGPNFGSPSGYLHLRDTTSSPSYIELAFDNSHPYLGLKYKNNWHTYFNGAIDSGDGAAMLPRSSVAKQEILDEPGVTSNIAVNSVEITGSTAMKDVVTTSITVPSSGFIVVIASGQVGFHDVTTANYLSYQIDQLSGGGDIPGYYRTVGMDAPPNSAYSYQSITSQRTFQVNAGTYEFRLEARDNSGTGKKYFWNPSITAMYFPSAYGSVTAAVSGSEAQQFDDKTPITIDQRSDATEDNDGYFLVDLRELERKAEILEAAEAKLRLEKAEVERQLRRAQQHIQDTTSSTNQEKNNKQ